MPEGFFIGSFEIRFYGIILMLGAVAGALSARPGSRGLPPRKARRASMRCRMSTVARDRISSGFMDAMRRISPICFENMLQGSVRQ